MPELHLQRYLGQWDILINPAILVSLLFVALDDAHRSSNIGQFGAIIIIFINLIYWIPVSYIAIKIIDKITGKFIRKKSNAAVSQHDFESRGIQDSMISYRTPISFFKNKKLNLLYIILPIWGIITMAFVFELHYNYHYLGIWKFVINPAVLVNILVMTLDGGDSSKIELFNVNSLIISNLMYWIPATFMIIKFIEWCKKRCSIKINKKIILSLVAIVVIIPVLGIATIYDNTDKIGKEYAAKHLGDDITIGGFRFNILNMSEQQEVNRAQIIIEGVIISERPFWKVEHNDKDPWIITEYAVKVTDVIKGDVSVDQTVNVLIRGGTLDGMTSTNTNSLDIESGDNAIMLLRQDVKSIWGAYHPIYVSKSIYIVEDEIAKNMMPERNMDKIQLKEKLEILAGQ